MIQHVGGHVEGGGVTVVQPNAVENSRRQRGVFAHVAPQKRRIIGLFAIPQLTQEGGPAVIIAKEIQI